jgi:hypothetical protein
VDLTVEFEESCFAQCRPRGYLNVACWDGTPPSPTALDVAAAHCAATAAGWAATPAGGVAGPAGVARAQRADPVLVHCAHGRGRSTTVLVAALVKHGCFATWQQAFAHCQAKRPCVKLNAKMRAALADWASEFAANEKKAK